MTQPNSDPPFVKPLDPGPGLADSPVKPQPAAPLTDQQLRLECVTLAVQAKVDPRYLTASADRVFEYVRTGIPNTGDTTRRGEGA